MDNANNLFEHIRNRLPDGYGFGDDGTKLDDSLVPDHKTFQQSIREDREGDVGIFEIYQSEQPNYRGYTCYIGEVQIAVVTRNGNIGEAQEYLRELYDNLNSNTQSEHVWIKNCKMINLKPLGKNSNGLHMVVLNLKIKYLIN